MIQVTIRLAALFTLNLLASLIHRFRHGAKLSELIKTRFYEVLPIRSLFWTLFGSLIYGILLFSFASLRNIYSVVFSDEYSSKAPGHLLINGVFVGLLGVVLWLVRNHLLQVPLHNAVSVKTAHILMRYGIAPHLVKNLGTERFPNEISPMISPERNIRWLFAIIGVFCIGLIVFLVLKNEEYGLGINFNQSVEKLMLQAPSTWDIAYLCAILVIPTLIVLLLLNNRDYTFINFDDFLCYKFLLFFAIIACTKWLGFGLYTTILVVALVIASYGLRAISDLTTESKYKKLKQVYNPIVSKIREYTSYLDQIPSDPHLRLGSLQTDLLSHRVSQGCKNIEERGIFVTRNFGRFLKLIEVQHEEFAVAMLRYLTVRRYITRSSSSGTSRWLQHPKVPMWDLDLFPLKPPFGYVNWTDPLWLPSQWDIVETCGTCGGSGTVTVTVSDGEGNSRTETRTCSTCSGSGRLQYTQILNTQWQRLLPLVTYPEIPTPELVEDAEEQVIYRLPLAENFSSCNESAQVMRTNSLLMSRMRETGEQLEYLHKLHKSEVETLHGGYLYRADFQVASFRTIMIEFANLGGSIGWFFGRRPEFYFPRLPLSWVTVFTFALLPPLWIALFIFLWETSVVIFPLLVE